MTSMLGAASGGGGGATAAAMASQQDKLFEEICAQNQNFDHYERAFQEVLMELESDDILETFRREYESLHNSFLKCHEGEKRLIKKCIDLLSETTSCQQKIRAAEELSQGDQSTIDQLKKEIVKTKSKVALSRESEITLKEKIKQLKADIKELDAQVDRGVAGIVGHDANINELTRVRAEVQKNYETQRTHLTALQHEMQYVTDRVVKSRESKSAKEGELRELRLTIEQRNNDVDEQRARKTRKDQELRQMKEELAKRSRQHGEGQSLVATLNAEIHILDQKVSAGKESSDQSNRHLAYLGKQMLQTHQQLAECAEIVEGFKKEIAKMSQQLKLKDGEVAHIHKERLKQEKLLHAQENKNTVLTNELRDAEVSRDTARLEVQQKELECTNIGKLLEGDRKQLEDLSRERDVLNKSYLKAQSATQKQQDWLVIKENQKRNLEHQIKGFERHAQQQNELIFQLTKETESYEQDAADATVTYAKTTEEIRTLDRQCDEEQVSILETEGKLRQQQGMLETVLNERNLYAKNFNQLRIEVAEIGRRSKAMISQIKQLKEEIQSKERELVTEEASVSVATTLRKKHEIHIDACKKKTEKRHKTINAYNIELHKLNQIIADADAERARQQRDHTNVVNERDILGVQLVRRNDELALLYERIRIQQFQLRQGEAQYGDRLRDVENLELRIAQLDEELGKMRQFAARLPELKLLINKTQRELTREQCRVRALLDECDNPQNVHRLHRLAWSEPETYALHQRVQQLQRILVNKNNEVAQKNGLIGEKEKLFVELKGVIARQPGPEVAEQLNVYQDTLTKKVTQMKAMKMSLRHFQEQVEHFKGRYEELNEDLNEMGRSYFQRRRDDTKRRRKEAVLASMLGRSPNYGGGEDGGEVISGDQPYVGYTAPPRPVTAEDGSEGYQSGGGAGDGDGGGYGSEDVDPSQPPTAGADDDGYGDNEEDYAPPHDEGPQPPA